MKSYAVLAVALAITANCCLAQNLDECLQKDSISCIQKSIFRKAKELLQKDSYEIVSGVSLVKSERSARSSNDLAAEQEIEKAESVAERQSAIENYVGGEVANFFSGRSLRVNFAPAMEKIGSAARALSDSIPAEIQQVADDVVEGRNKKKHMLKRFLPLIALAKAKLGFLAVLGYFALALIAKKAIFISLVSIALSAFVGLRGLFSRGMGHVVESAPWSASGPSGSYSSGAASWAPAPAAAANSWSANGPNHGWEDGHAAQSQAYSGYTQ